MKLFCNFYLRGWLWKKDLKEKSLVLIFEIAMEEKISIPIRSRIFCFFFSGRVERIKKKSATEASTEAVMTTDKLIIKYYKIVI